jgi:hypothetical protein
VGELVRIPVGGGGWVTVRTMSNEPQVSTGPVRAGLGDRVSAVAREASRSLQEMLTPAVEVARAVSEQFAERCAEAVAPSSVEVRLGLELGIEGGVIVAMGTAAAALEVTVGWTFPGPGADGNTEAGPVKPRL